MKYLGLIHLLILKKKHKLKYLKISIKMILKLFKEKSIILYHEYFIIF